MLSFLLAVHFVLAVLIIVLVLLQKHEADGVLGTGGGGANKVFSIRGQANILTRSTAILMTFFFINCLIMAKMVKHTPSKVSIIDRVANESIPADAAANGGSNNENAAVPSAPVSDNSNSSSNNIAEKSAANIAEKSAANIATTVPAANIATTVPTAKNGDNNNTASSAPASPTTKKAPANHPAKSRK